MNNPLPLLGVISTTVLCAQLPAHAARDPNGLIQCNVAYTTLSKRLAAQRDQECRSGPPRKCGESDGLVEHRGPTFRSKLYQEGSRSDEVDYYGSRLQQLKLSNPSGASHIFYIDLTYQHHRDATTPERDLSIDLSYENKEIPRYYIRKKNAAGLWEDETYLPGEGLEHEFVLAPLRLRIGGPQGDEILGRISVFCLYRKR